MDRATKALIDYGFTAQPDGSLERGRKGERFVPTEGGFLRFFRGEPMCYTIKPEWANVGGLSPADKPECFDMVYPSAWVIAEYEAANGRRAAYLAEKTISKAG